MILTSENTFNNANLTLIDESIKNVIKSAVSTYWEQNADISLCAINDFLELREEKLSENLNFFTTQIKVENHTPVVIRLNDEFVDSFLALALESDKKIFKLDALTPLEIRILNGFSEFLYKRLNEILTPVKKIKISENNDFNPRNNINILYYIKAKKAPECARLMLSVPKERLKFEQIKKAPSFVDSDFVSSCAYVTIKVGTSKITLKDLKELQEEDIILLENSEINKSVLISGAYQQKFSVKVNPSLILNLDEEEMPQEENSENNLENYEVNMEKNLWDDIEVEIGAEFEKVKMSIGELKQLTQGQTVDLGSIFESEISLYVENKKVAQGELLIINDRYAVKLNKILSNPKARTQEQPAKGTIAAPKQAPPQKAPASAPRAQHAQAPRVQAQSAPKQAPPAQKPIQTQAAKEQKEDFDYSDFEK